MRPWLTSHRPRKMPKAPSTQRRLSLDPPRPPPAQSGRVTLHAALARLSRGGSSLLNGPYVTKSLVRRVFWTGALQKALGRHPLSGVYMINWLVKHIYGGWSVESGNRLRSGRTDIWWDRPGARRLDLWSRPQLMCPSARHWSRRVSVP